MTARKNGARNNAVGRAKPAQVSHSPARNQRCLVRASCVANRAKNTTTTCAVNQYVPSEARYQNGVPSAKSSVIQRWADSEITIECGASFDSASSRLRSECLSALPTKTPNRAYTNATSIAPRTTLNSTSLKPTPKIATKGSISNDGIGDPATNHRPPTCSRS